MSDREFNTRLRRLEQGVEGALDIDESSEAEQERAKTIKLAIFDQKRLNILQFLLQTFNSYNSTTLSPTYLPPPPDYTMLYSQRVLQLWPVHTTLAIISLKNLGISAQSAPRRPPWRLYIYALCYDLCRLLSGIVQCSYRHSTGVQAVQAHRCSIFVWTYNLERTVTGVRVGVAKAIAEAFEPVAETTAETTDKDATGDKFENIAEDVAEDWLLG
ncbi:hypothetical protein BO71DRAFT_428317 [Aspergillus ellipticus CBS 707.79]|uniref:Uncharacterized protein n=1 Tax=Aspergillus ellipticus CBS 707.79 TaxID=1448320 RepID=A0A319DFI0_9EURO|nr:hypothetical protein BO71DRAFT_428317 [Aspergillus ellipticus CBS 707.79]